MFHKHSLMANLYSPYGGKGVGSWGWWRSHLFWEGWDGVRGASKGSSAFALQRHLGLGLDGDNYPAQPPSGSSSCDPLRLTEHQR